MTTVSSWGRNKSRTLRYKKAEIIATICEIAMKIPGEQNFRQELPSDMDLKMAKIKRDGSVGHIWTQIWAYQPTTEAEPWKLP